MELSSQRAAEHEAGRRRVPVLTIGGLGAHANDLGCASTLPGPASDVERREARARLGIGEGELVVLASDGEGDGRTLAELIDASASVPSRPMLLVAGPRPHAAAEAARRARARTVCVGVTRDPGLLLAAADVAAACAPAGPVSTGRFIADAVRTHTPVLAAPNSGGAALIAAEFPDDPSPGWLLPANRPRREAWADALLRAADVGWRQRCRDAAARVAPTLGVDALVARLVRRLKAWRESMSS